ncbi:hexokinase [Microthyrium microscopicum]|uniref:Phosphotransferase n=1 Tax=Microthyrium microscopicum TaxID=703497 RepID=A0A6A6UI21_9PEZI|nr:hexokinase [Microthyrium microscopicum]
MDAKVSSRADCPDNILDQIKRLEELFTVETEQLKAITKHFVDELNQGLTVEGGDIPMVPTWCMGKPKGDETGTFLAIDMGGTNLRICEINLPEAAGAFEITQSKYRLPEELKSGEANELWDYVAHSIEKFVKQNHDIDELGQLPLGFTFSYPVSQESIDHGVLQRWTKGFNVKGVEGEDVVPQFEAALAKRKLPIKLTALVNDTTGTLIASAYTNPEVQIGCIFGTGCNAAYMDKCGNIPKIAHLNLDPEIPMAINCEWGAFDNQHKVLPRTSYDIIIDKASPRPGQQTFEKMVAGLYLGEIFRLTLVDLHEHPDCLMFKDQAITKLSQPYGLDASFLSKIEVDPFENLDETAELFHSTLDIKPSRHELELIRRLAELIGTRAARLTACGIAAICTKQNWTTAHVGADGSVFTHYPHFKARQAQALKEILDWPANQGKGAGDPIEVVAAEDGSGVGAALIAALTIKRVQDGNVAGIKNVDGVRAAAGIA